MIFLKVPLHVAQRFVSIIRTLIIVLCEGICTWLPYAWAKPVLVLVCTPLESDWVCWVSVHQIIERSQTVEGVNICEIIIRDLVSLILNLRCAILFTLVFLFCTPVFGLGDRRRQLTELGYVLGERPRSLALDELRNWWDSGVSCFLWLHDVWFLAVNLLVLSLILIWLIGMDSGGAVFDWRTLPDLSCTLTFFDGH